jgi:hypothetical protein
MKQQIRHLPVHRNARVMALLTALVSAVGVALMLAVLPFATTTGGSSKTEAVAWLLAAPLLYAAVAYLTTALCCAVYNAMASRWGGFELELGVTVDVGVDSRFPTFSTGQR